MAASSQSIEIKVARNLPISNTGNVALRVTPVVEGGGPVVVTIVEVSQSALLVPGEYDVYPVIFFPKPPGVATGPGPVVFPLAHISYDHALQHFSVQVNPKTTLGSGQFSVLLNMSDLLLLAK